MERPGEVGPRLPSFFPKVPASCKAVAAPLFDCLTAESELNLDKVWGSLDGDFITKYSTGELYFHGARLSFIDTVAVNKYFAFDTRGCDNILSCCSRTVV